MNNTMESQTKTCQNCKNSFTIEPEDFEFFKQMSVSVPELCLECGVGRAMALRNERHLYKGACGKCGKATLSMYSPDYPYVVYCHDCWWGDSWNGSDFGLEYNSNRPLLDQMRNLQKIVPREALVIRNSTNCDYGNHVRNSKDIYFSYLIALSENVLYSTWISNNVKDCINCSKVIESELVAYCIDISKCYNSAFLQDCVDCSDCYFSFDLKGCTNCIFSFNLRNKSYYAFNRQVSKEEFKKIKQEYFDGSFKKIIEGEERYNDLINKALRKFAFILNSYNTKGNYSERCNNAIWCFDGFNTEDVKGVASILNAKRGMYSYSIGTDAVEFFFGCSVIKGGTNLKYCFNIASSSDCIYCDSLVSSSNCIASVGLKYKEYCILNKQYSKEEYFKIKEQLQIKEELQHMPSPPLTMFAYNETVAFDHYPMQKEEAIAKGYRWQNDPQLTRGQETIQPDKIQDNIKDVQDDITKHFLKCIICARNYRIILEELLLYRKFDLPLPRICPQCRFAQRRAARLPYKLWHRKCQCSGSKSSNNIYTNTINHQHGSNPCPNEFETSYAPERPEVVYCESCYQQEVV